MRNAASFTAGPALAALSLLLTVAAASAADKVLFLPEAVLATVVQTPGNNPTFHYDYGPATCIPTDVPGPGIRFDCSNVGGSGTGYASGYPINSLIGCTGSDCSAYRDGDGNDKYRMKFTNLTSNCPLRVNLYMTTGWPSLHHDAFYEGQWAWINKLEWAGQAVVELDLNNARCWGSNCTAGNGGYGPVDYLNETSKLGFQIAQWEGCTTSFSFILSPFDQETGLTSGNNTTIACAGHSLQSYSPSGTLYYNNFDQGFRGYVALSGMLPNHRYLLSFEGLAADVALTSDELAACGVAIDDGGRLTTPGGTWPASGGGEFAGMQVVFVDFEDIQSDASGDYSGSFYFDCNGLISDGDLFKTRFIVKDAHAWSIHDCTGGWENEALYADNVDFDPPFDEDGDGHTTESEVGAGSDPNDATSIPTQEVRFYGERRGTARDRLITYATVTGRRVTPAAPGRYTMIVNWGPSVHPDTFRARLNRKDVTALFTPVLPGSARVITLPLDPGRRHSRLMLQISGDVLGRRGRLRLRKDRDRLLFTSPEK